MGNKNGKNKKLVLTKDLNKKIADILILKKDDDYSNKLRSNRSKNKNDDNTSSMKSFPDTFNSYLKYRIRSRSRTRDRSKTNMDNSLLNNSNNIKPVYRDENEEYLNHAPEEVEFIGLTNKILNEIYSLNKPYNGNTINFYNSCFLNNFISSGKSHELEDDRKELRRSKTYVAGNNVNTNNSIAFKRQTTMMQNLNNNLNTNKEYFCEQGKILRNMFNIRKILLKTEEENSLSESRINFLDTSNNFLRLSTTNNLNNFLNTSLINNMTSTSFNLGNDNKLNNSILHASNAEFSRMKSEEKVLKNSVSISPNGELSPSNNPVFIRENSNFNLNTSQENINDENYFNENEIINPNEKSLLEKSNYYNNHELDFYADEKKNYKKDQYNTNANNNPQNQSFYLGKSLNNGNGYSSNSKSREKQQKRYKKRVYNHPPIVHIKMDLKDFIKDEVQEQSFYRNNPHLLSSKHIKNSENNNNLKQQNQTNRNFGNYNNKSNPNKDKLYDVRNLSKTKLNNSHLSNRKFADVITKYSQLDDYREKLNNRKKQKDRDYNHILAKQRENNNNINNYDYNVISSRNPNNSEYILQTIDNNEENDIDFNNISDISNYKVHYNNKNILNASSDEDAQSQNNFSTNNIYETENNENYYDSNVNSNNKKNKMNNNYKNNKSHFNNLAPNKPTSTRDAINPPKNNSNNIKNTKKMNDNVSSNFKQNIISRGTSNSRNGPHKPFNSKDIKESQKKFNNNQNVIRKIVKVSSTNSRSNDHNSSDVYNNEYSPEFAAANSRRPNNTNYNNDYYKKNQKRKISNNHGTEENSNEFVSKRENKNQNYNSFHKKSENNKRKNIESNDSYASYEEEASVRYYKEENIDKNFSPKKNTNSNYHHKNDDNGYSEEEDYHQNKRPHKNLHNKKNIHKHGDSSEND